MILNHAARASATAPHACKSAKISLFIDLTQTPPPAQRRCDLIRNVYLSDYDQGGYTQCIVKVFAETHRRSTVHDRVLFKPHLIFAR